MPASDFPVDHVVMAPSFSRCVPLTRRAIWDSLARDLGHSFLPFSHAGTAYAKPGEIFLRAFCVVPFLVLWLFDIPLSGFPFRDKPIFPALRFKEPKILVQLLCTANAKSFGFFGH